MTRRSLSRLYRAEVLRNGATVDAEQLLALATVPTGDAAALEKLACTPDAAHLMGIARSIGPWATGLAADMGRSDHVAPSHRTPRVRNFAWVSLAAAAGLAVVVGLAPRQELDTSSQASAGAVTARYESDADVLFADPDGVLISATLDVEGESIFADSLDM